MPLVFTRLLREALFAASALTFYDEVSPCNALCGRQPAMLPVLPVLDPEQPTKTSDHSREQMIRHSSSQETNRALRTKTIVTGQHYYDEGDLVDYHCPTTTKGDWGGWNGPFPIVKHDPERGQVTIRVGGRDVKVQYGDARHSLYIEALIASGIGFDSTALQTALTFVASIPAGGLAVTLDYVPTKKGMLQIT
eukprot:9494020-Pyramimonas_sp.AAC.1